MKYNLLYAAHNVGGESSTSIYEKDYYIIYVYVKTYMNNRHYAKIQDNRQDKSTIKGELNLWR